MDVPNEIRDRLLRDDPNFRRLSRKHREYEERLADLQSRRFPTDEERLEESQIKKLKLAVKDDLERILRATEGTVR